MQPLQDSNEMAAFSSDDAVAPALARLRPGLAASVPRVLFESNDAENLHGLRSGLRDLDVELVSAASGTQAMAQLHMHDFIAIVLDAKGGMDGFETARRIRANPRSSETPIIFLHAQRGGDPKHGTGYALLAADYLFMPVSPTALKMQIERLIDTWYASSTSASDAWAEHLIAEHAGDYVALLDRSGAWLYAGASYQRQFGVSIPSDDDYVVLVHEQDRERVRAELAAATELACHERSRRMQYRVTAHPERYFETDTFPIRDASTKVVKLVLVSQDITERRKREAYVLHQSLHDALTGLPNRTLLSDRISQAIMHRERMHATVALLFIDLDHFKEVNDTLGHAAGDALLLNVAERLCCCVRDGDTVARLGGDEFVVMLPGLHDAHSAGLVAAKIVALVSDPYDIAGRKVHVAPSIGIATLPGDGADADSLLHNADTAMYCAKRQGGARYCFFTSEMEEAASRKLALGAALRRAIGEGEFSVHYQPKIDARSGAICAFKAHIVWFRHDDESVGPDVLVPIAEESGQLESIGRWVLGAAVGQLQRWHGLGFEDLPIAVNLSAQQLRRDDVASHLDAVLRDAGIAPTLLEIEFTEAAVMGNPAQAMRALQQIHALGIPITIDDFGTGSSSPAFLRRLPVDKLKIAPAFVRHGADDPVDAAIVKAIIDLGHALNLTVIADGVETADQLAFLVEQGCDEMQGNYFSAAVSHDDALGLLRRGPFQLAAKGGMMS
jgi:diguanylate cyclase (GGDEF)-like protein/PAS domain S-box-containing protein